MLQSIFKKVLGILISLDAIRPALQYEASFSSYNLLVAESGIESPCLRDTEMRPASKPSLIIKCGGFFYFCCDLLVAESGIEPPTCGI